MAIRKVIKEGDETLRKISKPVTDFDDRLGELLDDMFDTLAKYEGAGLSAVQVGVLKRAFVMKIKEPRECINPRLIREEGENKIKIEGCLSVPGKCGYVNRPERVWVEYQDRNGTQIKKKFTGFEAKCFCHELDHLDGILYIDKATKMFKDKEEYRKAQDKELKQKNAKSNTNNVKNGEIT